MVKGCWVRAGNERRRRRPADLARVAAAGQRRLDDLAVELSLLTVRLPILLAVTAFGVTAGADGEDLA